MSLKPEAGHLSECPRWRDAWEPCLCKALVAEKRRIEEDKEEEAMYYYYYSPDYNE